MKFTKALVEDRVGTFREQIIQRTGIPIEEIEVVEESFNYMAQRHGYYVVMTTSPGKISFDPKRNHDLSVSLDRFVLHELGHRSGDVLSPNRQEVVIKSLSGLGDSFYKKTNRVGKIIGLSKVIVQRNLVVPKVIDEGIAEFFGLDVFPSVCDLDKVTQLGLADIRWNHLCLADPDHIQSRGYNFFAPLSAVSQPLKTMVNYLTNFSSVQVPSKRELDYSEDYWAKQGIKYGGSVRY